MTESLSRTSEKSGLPPGSLIHVGEILDSECRISIIHYDKLVYEEHSVQSIDEILPYKHKKAVTWVNIEGLKDVTLIQAIGQQFDIHPLTLEDILNTHQRTKFEDHENYLFIVVKGLAPENDELSVAYEQISIVILDNFVFTFKEKRDELFNPIKYRLKNSKGRFRSLGTDYLGYVIIDAIVDEYFSITDSFLDNIEKADNELMENPTSQTLASLQQIKRELIFIRKSVSPVRELLTTIEICDSPLIKENTKIYFRDVYDHSIRVIESIDSYRELINGMLDIYLSSVSNKMNETMKVLTVFASIFIPLTFITGIYGMNFEFMPELKWKWSYPLLWIGFVILPILLMIYFKKKKWL